MAIEVRQLVIKSTVDGCGGAQPQDGQTSGASEQLKEEILAECKAWFEEKLRQLKER